MSDAQKLVLQNILTGVSHVMGRDGDDAAQGVLFTDSLNKNIDPVVYLLAKVLIQYKTSYSNTIDLNQIFSTSQNQLHAATTAAMVLLTPSSYSQAKTKTPSYNCTSALFGRTII